MEETYWPAREVCNPNHLTSGAVDVPEPPSVLSEEVQAALVLVERLFEQGDGCRARPSRSSVLLHVQSTMVTPIMLLVRCLRMPVDPRVGYLATLVGRAERLGCQEVTLARWQTGYRETRHLCAACFHRQ